MTKIKQVKSKFLELTSSDIYKNCRDAIIVGLGTTLLTIFDLLKAEDYGIWTGVVVGVITFLSQSTNRFVNAWRVDNKIK